MENSKLRVIHKSLIFDAVKEGEETYLSEVLRALEEKYKKKESQVKLILTWLSSKLCCGENEQNKIKDDSKEIEANKNEDKEQLEENVNKDDPQEKKDNLEEETDNDNQQEKVDSLETGNVINAEETEESLEDDKNNEEEKETEKQSSDETLVAHLQELEDAHVQFAKKTAEASNHEEVKKEIEDMKDRVGDLKNGVITGDAEKETPLWDAVNEEGDTCLHISTLLNKPEVTKMLLKAGANVNIENPKGETALHNACRHGAIDEATSLIEKGANLVLNKKNETPALENLLFENQDVEKVKNLMSAIHNSNDKVKFLKKIFEENVMLFKMQNPALIRAVVDTDEPDEDLAHFVNLQDPMNNNNTGLHLACQRSCHASASWLLKAGGYKLKANGGAFTPSLETLFTKEKSLEITDHLVRGLIRKASMNLLPPEEAIRYLQKEQTGGFSLLNLVEDRSWFDELTAADGVGVEIAELAPTMGAQFANWLLAKTEQEDWEKKSVYEHLLEPNRGGKIALAHFTDSSVYNKVAEAVGAEEMAEAASYMGPEFANWMLVKTEEENLDKEEVFRGIVEVNDWGKTALVHFADSRTWEKVAEVVGADIAKSASAMGPEFTQWLLLKIDQDGWNEKQVYWELVEVNGACKAALAHCADKNFWEKVSEVVGVNIVKSVVAMPLAFTEWLEQKVKEDKDKVYQLLCQATREHQTALSNPSLRAPMWTKLSTWAPEKGLHFLIENNDLKEALKTWQTTLAADIDEENEEEAEELVQTLIEKKGGLVKLLGDDNDLESAVQQWNERNKQLSE